MKLIPSLPQRNEAAAPRVGRRRQIANSMAWLDIALRRPGRGPAAPGSAAAVRIIWGAALLWSAPLLAHEEGGRAAGLVAGLAHPVSGFDHVLAMVAVGLWGAQLGVPALWLLPVAFPLVMALGGMLGLVGLPLPGVEIGIALSAVLLGAAVCAEARPKLAVAVVAVGAFAIFHGHAHGTELPAGESGLLYSLGFVVATGCLHGVGIALGLAHRHLWGKRALRVAGGMVALGGVFFLWRAVA